MLASTERRAQQLGVTQHRRVRGRAPQAAYRHPEMQKVAGRRQAERILPADQPLADRVVAREASSKQMDFEVVTERETVQQLAFVVVNDAKNAPQRIMAARARVTSSR